MIEADLDERIEKAIESSTPDIYFNGFVNKIGSSDVLIVLERNGEPVAKLNASYTVVKTLGMSLLGMVSSFEKVVGRSILTTHEIDNYARKAEGESGGNSDE